MWITIIPLIRHHLDGMKWRTDIALSFGYYIKVVPNSWDYEQSAIHGRSCAGHNRSINYLFFYQVGDTTHDSLLHH